MHSLFDAYQAKVDKLKEAAGKLCSTSFITGLEYSVQRKKVMVITTGAKQLDELLGGNKSPEKIRCETNEED